MCRWGLVRPYKRFLYWVISRSSVLHPDHFVSTLQVISFLFSFFTLDFTVLLLVFWSRKVTLAVVLCPLSVTDGWLSEFSKFCPSFRVLQYVGDKLHRRDLRRYIYEDVQKASTSSRSNVCSSVTENILGSIFLRCIPWFPSICVTSFLFLVFFLHVTGITVWCAHDNIWHSLDGSRFPFTNPLALCSYWWSSTS
jgi:hypothetical protein